ncbi:mannosyltransferase [uncultured Psychroserpens sp.]|uniref:mannosyltransferase n=1 Tax=uncultured Psychroserpens sp. TaxID=255436 RepID=UPI002613A1DF|nr:mannosyltransferase [uncultured Psychroserpens sp.]
MQQFWKLNKVPLLLTFVSVLLYWYVAYNLVRTDYTSLILLYSSLWLVFILLLKYTIDNIRFLTVIAFLSRAILILAIPNLSQDFYRFIWDGRMILEGFNPYLYTPESFMQSGNLPVNQAEALYEGMGQLNGSHYTNYPPINQLCFVIAGLFSGHSILGSAVVLRLLIIAADFGTFFFGKQLLKTLGLPIKNIFWFILNPFIIIELTGNLHFEGVMIFFLVWSLYLLHIGRWKWAAVVFALSISVKLIPLLFLPLLFRYFKKPTVISSIVETSKTPLDYAGGDNVIDYKTLVQFYIIVGLTTCILFAPFFSLEFVNNYAETVGLWFQNFEFNGSIYYIAREIGYRFRGYNEIAVIGKILPVVVFLIVIGLAFFRRQTDTRQLVIKMLLAFTCYLFLSTTVHPWYVATLLILGVFTNYKFPLVWSFVIILSYLAYININTMDKSENLWVIALEYIVVYAIFIWEVFINKANSKELASL